MGDTKRKMLTPAERVAKIERELAEAKVKAEAKDRKRMTELGERREALVAAIQERTDKVEVIDAEMAEIRGRIGAPSLEVVSNSADSDDAEAAAV